MQITEDFRIIKLISLDIIFGLEKLTTSDSTGKVKFYSAEKGYGFIHDVRSGNDVFFHITAVTGPEAPSNGDIVSFELVEREKGRIAARRVEIVQSAKSMQQQRNRPTLNGFPCIQGGSIARFKTAKILGRISAGNGIFTTYYSVNDARDALVEKAKLRGANGIVNFVWQREPRRTTFRTKKMFGSGYNYHHRNNDYFWCEGDAVLLVAID